MPLLRSMEPQKKNTSKDDTGGSMLMSKKYSKIKYAQSALGTKEEAMARKKDGWYDKEEVDIIEVS